MSLPPLTLIPAGAGSGKTYTIEQRLGEWVCEGLVRPEAIVAVTFTEAAARELRERIRARLITLGRLDAALRLDEAYISTIHGFGSRLLAEFAFENGSSPAPRLLNDDEQNVLVRQAIAQTDKVAAITRDLRRFGYIYDIASGTGPEDAFREEILRLVGLLRAMGWVAADPRYASRAAAWIRARYGPTVDGACLTTRLHEAVEALLAAFPESLAGLYPQNQSATNALRRDFRNLHRALDPERLAADWKLWSELADLRPSKRGSALPDGYDALADVVREAAAELPLHPGPLASAEDQVVALIDAAQDVLVHYAAAKHEAGLVDYTDMVALANSLLGRDRQMLETLLGRADCLVVDEFQDTNPLQFALVWHLYKAGVPALVVGDLKQAIMGFQGADPRLFEALQAQHPDELAPLRHNWRSQPPIMAFVNTLGGALFPETYIELEPQADESPLAPLEAIRYRERPRPDGHFLRALSLGMRLKALIEDPEQRIHDRHLGRTRRLRGSDVAVLCPTHKMLADYARALRLLGLEVQLEEAGWLGSRAVQVALAALAYVANPEDRHAALYLEVTELGTLTLEQGVRILLDGRPVRSPMLARLEALAEQTAERTVYALVAETFAALELLDTVLTWPGARQHRANLLRLLAEAGEFMDAQREALAFGGFHGSGLQTFLAWVHHKAEHDDAMPAPSVLDENAVELVTWHSAKGREWPVVAVGGLDRDIKVTLPHVTLGYPDFDDLGGLLERAAIEYSPKFASRVTNERFLEPLRANALIEARRLLYVALTRAREKLVLEWPEYRAGSDAMTYWGVLAAECGLALADDAFVLDEARFPCLVHPAVVHSAEDAAEPEPQANALIRFGRRAIHHGPPPAATTPDIVSASSLAVTAPDRGVRVVETEDYADPLELDAGGAAIGTRLHRCFEVLGAARQPPEVVARILATDPADAAVSHVIAHVEAFEEWLARRFPDAQIHREWPVLGLRGDGSVLTGTIDLMIREGDDVWIIDHKSDQAGDRADLRAIHAAQLAGYAEIVGQQGLRVRSTGINWIRHGTVDFLEVSTA